MMDLLTEQLTELLNLIKDLEGNPEDDPTLHSAQICKLELSSGLRIRIVDCNFFGFFFPPDPECDFSENWIRIEIFLKAR